MNGKTQLHFDCKPGFSYIFSRVETIPMNEKPRIQGDSFEFFYCKIEREIAKFDFLVELF